MNNELPQYGELSPLIGILDQLFKNEVRKPEVGGQVAGMETYRTTYTGYLKSGLYDEVHKLLKDKGYD